MSHRLRHQADNQVIEQKSSVPGLVDRLVVMTVVLRSLSDFKRFLRKPGATIQIVHNTLIERQPPQFREAYRRKGLYEPRTVRAMSKKAAVFDVKGHEETVWLYWDRGTRKWKFHGDTVAVPLNAAMGAPDEVVYRCSLAGDQSAVPPPRLREDDDAGDEDSDD